MGLGLFLTEGRGVLKRSVKVYDALFPLWLLFFFDFQQMWIFVLPGNFIIDSLVLLIAMSLIKLRPKWDFYKKHILQIFFLGLLSDIISSVLLFAVMLFLHIGRLGDEPYLTIPALIVSGTLIFIFNYFITFKALDKRERMTLSLIFAIFTAPYTFLVPSSWLYS